MICLELAAYQTNHVWCEALRICRMSRQLSVRSMSTYPIQRGDHLRISTLQVRNATAAFKFGMQVVTTDNEKLGLLLGGRVSNTALLQVMAKMSPNLARSLVCLMEQFSLLYVIDAASSLVPPLLPLAAPKIGAAHMKVGQVLACRTLLCGWGGLHGRGDGFMNLTKCINPASGIAALCFH